MPRKLINRIRHWASPSNTSGPRPAPFVVGVSRSGTTLLRLMLDAHPDLAIPPETHFIPRVVKECSDSESPRQAFLKVVTSHPRWKDYRVDAETFRKKITDMESFDVSEALRIFYRTYAERFSKPRWGDKTPMYVRRMEVVSRVLPEARFIHLIRDGREVALSAMKTRVGPATVEAWAKRWRSWILEARSAAESLGSVSSREGLPDGRYMEVRYEDLVLEPEVTLRGICAFVDLSWNPAMLNYHDKAEQRIEELNHDLPRKKGHPIRRGEDRVAMHTLTSKPPQRNKIGAWRKEMTPEDVRRFEAVAGGMLTRLGYKRTT